MRPMFRAETPNVMPTQTSTSSTRQENTRQGRFN
ncbi:HflK [Pasteurella multocida subsp. multocida str. Anand1_cattle]|nr:HflK [Pasteurella multocida subsp. multocida str. Anand1_cattle]